MAFNVITEINLDMTRPNVNVVNAVQYDSSGRVVKAHLFNGATPWAVPSGVYPVIRFQKSDRIGGFYDIDENNAYAISYENNRTVINITLALQVLTTVGNVDVQINFYNSSGQRVTAFSFRVQVQRSVIPDSEIVSSEYYNALTATLSNSIEAIQSIEETAAYVTDISNRLPTIAADWLAANMTNPSNPAIDKSLSISGAAADAKVTGDRVDKLENSVSNNRINVVYNISANGTDSSDNGVDINTEFIKGKRITVEFKNLSPDTGGGYMYVRFSTSKADPENSVVASVGGLVEPNASKVFTSFLPDNVVYAYVKNTNKRNISATVYITLVDIESELVANELEKSTFNNAISETLINHGLQFANLFPLESIVPDSYYTNYSGNRLEYSGTVDNYYTLDPFILQPGSYYFYGISSTFSYYRNLKTGYGATFQSPIQQLTINEPIIVYITFRTTDRPDNYDWLKCDHYCVRCTNVLLKPYINAITNDGVISVNPKFIQNWWNNIDLKVNKYKKINIQTPHSATYTSNITNVRFFNLNLSEYIFTKGINPSDILIRFSCNRKIPSLYEEYNTIADGRQYDTVFQPILYKYENDFYYYAVLFRDDSLITANLTYSDISRYVILHQGNIEASQSNPCIFTLIDACYLQINTDTAENDAANTKVLIRNPNWDSMIHISVKKDGSGDFTSIQPAINSISDASINKQYVIDIYDDYSCTDLTELYFTSSPEIKNTNSNPTSEVAMVIGKDWVHVRGIGKKKKLYIESPNDLARNSFQYIVVIRPFGNQIYDNLDVSIKGGRYAIHHEALQNLNYHKTVMFKDMKIRHFGNDTYPNSTWTSSMAQACGTSSGTDWYYYNCEWIGSPETFPYYTHENMGFDAPCHLTFENCRMIDIRGINKFSGNGSGPYFGDIGSNQIGSVTIIGCNFPYFSGFSYANTRGLETTILSPDDVRQGGIKLKGHSNQKMVLNATNAEVIVFRSHGHDIKVVGGTAYDILWGEDFICRKHTNSLPGYTAGIRRVPDRNTATWGNNATNVYSIAARLGNCANSPKTLILKIDDTQYTITFRSNYMTSDGSAYSPTTQPYMNRNQIMQEVNDQLSAIGCPAVMSYYAETEFEYFDDMKRPAFNNSSDAIHIDKYYVPDMSEYVNGWKEVDADTIASDDIAIPAKTIMPDEAGMMILVKQAYINHSGTAGEYYKFDANGNLIVCTKDNAVFKQLTNTIMEIA